MFVFLVPGTALGSCCRGALGISGFCQTASPAAHTACPAPKGMAVLPAGSLAVPTQSAGTAAAPGETVGLQQPGQKQFGQQLEILPLRRCWKFKYFGY